VNSNTLVDSPLDRTRDKSSGFTLLECLMVLCICSILTATAAPLFGSVLDSIRGTLIADAVVSDLWLTRSEGVRRNARTALCRSSDGQRCADQGNWSQGWVVYEDRDENGQLGADDLVIAVRGGLPAGWLLKGNSTVDKQIGYTSMGVTKHPSGSFQAGTLTLCKRSANSTESRRIIINSMGRPRTEKVSVASC
jgi:type IV fimbrial biogenesis protein FimT